MPPLSQLLYPGNIRLCLARDCGSRLVLLLLHSTNPLPCFGGVHQTHVPPAGEHTVLACLRACRRLSPLAGAQHIGHAAAAGMDVLCRVVALTEIVFLTVSCVGA